MIDFKSFLAEKRILIIEDSLEYQALVERALGKSHLHTYASDLKTAEQVISKNQYDCILLDLSLPDGNGFDFLSQREDINCPVLILSASHEIGNKITGFSMGAQDYIEKPFKDLELAIRVKSKIEFFSATETTISKGCLKLNTQSYKANLKLEHKEKDIELTRKEFSLLQLFLKNESIIFSRETLLNKVWGDQNFVLERSVDSTISALRRKTSGWDYQIKAVYGAGYQLVKKEQKKSSQPVKAENDPTILNIFETESQTQLSLLKQNIMANEWKQAKKMVHKLKGTFSIFDKSLIGLADQIEGLPYDNETIESHLKEFYEQANAGRKSILIKKAS